MRKRQNVKGLKSSGYVRAISFEIDKSFFLVNINNNTSKDVNDCECQIAKINTAIFV